MQQAVLHQFPDVRVKYKFACRNKGVDLSHIADKVRKEIDNLGKLFLKGSEVFYLNGLRFLKKDYIDFLGLFRFNPCYVTVSDHPFGITIEGPWLHTILFEVPILAIVNEIYFQERKGIVDEGMQRLLRKVALLKAAPQDFSLAEFGTRRRNSRSWQAVVLQVLAKEKVANGTSNILLAKEHGLTPIGTMAHEWIQAGQALVRLVDSQKFMLESWVKEYRGDLGIALTDTLGIDAFLRDFDQYFAKLYDGVRHDSGNPYAFGAKVIGHYESLGINPKDKRAVFTDSLDVPTALDIHRQFHDRIRTSFGIGTNLTNDLGPEPLNIVIKLVECKGQPVAKLSDSPGKQMCEDEGYVKYLKSVFRIE